MRTSLKSLCQTLFEVAYPIEVNVFDFDDTLVRTKSYIYLVTQDGRHEKLTPAEYAVYEPQPGDQFDFSDFHQINSPEPIMHMLLKLKFAIRNLGPDNVFILTARGHGEPIRNFLEGVGIEGIRIVALGSGDPAAKAAVIRDEIIKRGIKIIKFYDDSAKNVAAVKSLRRDPTLPDDVQILSVKV